MTSPLHHCPTNQICALTSVAVRPRSDTTESAVVRERMGSGGGGGGGTKALLPLGRQPFIKKPFFTSSCIFHEFMNSPIQRAIGGRGWGDGEEGGGGGRGSLFHCYQPTSKLLHIDNFRTIQRQYKKPDSASDPPSVPSAPSKGHLHHPADSWSLPVRDRQKSCDCSRWSD